MGKIKWRLKLAKVYSWVRRWLPKNRFWRLSLLTVLAAIGLTVGSMYTIARWYIWSQSKKPLQMGVTFIPDYARWFGLNADTTFKAILNDLKPQQVRLVSYWEDIEPTDGHYDFKELDTEFAEAQAAGVKVSLAIGLRQPRWPECHAPSWAQVDSRPQSFWYPKLKSYMQAVIEHYKINPALDSYQLENEYFLKVFGKCTNFSRDRLIDEYNFAKSLDNTHTLIVSRSNNWVGLPIGQPRPDEFGISVYKRVWDRTFTHRYIEYPYPAWYYGFYAGAGEILTGKNLMIHELQAEPWMPDGISLNTSSTAEQYKSMNPKRFQDRFNYAKATGMRQIDFWGVEWWYWRKVHFNDPSFWNIAKKEFAQAKQTGN